MKKNTVILLLLFGVLLFAQDDHERDPRHFSRRFEELEKIKLLETLNLDEQTAIKFFTRRNQSKQNSEKLMQDGEELFDRIEDLLKKGDANNSSEYDKLIKQSIDIEAKILNERTTFIKSLNDILTKEQILKVILFEHNFKKDVRDLLIEKGRKKFMRERMPK